MDPVTSQPSYRLGCAALDVPETPLLEQDIYRQELIERELLPENLRKVKAVRVHNPIQPRRDASAIGPRYNEDGVHPGEFVKP
jgi:hypothetical protein